MTFRLFMSSGRLGAGRTLFASRAAGLGLGLTTWRLLARRPIANDTIVGDPLYQPTQPVVPKGRFSGNLNYQQLSIGSFSGLLLGYITGKISKLLVFLTVTGLLLVQFLQSRGVIEPGSLPLVKRTLRWGQENLHIQEFMLEKPSFKISFLASFIIAAFHA